MDIKEISSILNSSLYKVRRIWSKRLIQRRNMEQTTDSTDESGVSSVKSTSTDSYENTILNSMDAIASGIYNKSLQEVNVYGGIDLSAAST